MSSNQSHDESNKRRPNDQSSFAEMERAWLEKWDANGIIERYLTKNAKNKKTFSFQDGPITANNPMGVHHAWGRTYKDIWQKFYNLKGYRQRFQNGFDCQGLWVEVEVEKELGLESKRDIENLVPGDTKASIEKFISLCRERVHRFADVQTEQSKRLGYFMDWDNSYYTMDDHNNYMIWRVLQICNEHGWIYRGNESVPWCYRCESAISQHEILTEDYKEMTHETIFVALPINGRKDEYIVIWTTTPWTIPANVAVAVDPEMEYALVQGEGNRCYWMAKNAVSRVFGKKTHKVQMTVKGEKLVGLTYSAPFDEMPAVRQAKRDKPTKFHTVIATDSFILPISTEEGTGLVHIAPSAGTEDYKLGKFHDLAMIPVIKDDASYLDGFESLSGKNAKEKPGIIFAYLDKQDDIPWTFMRKSHRHRYPVCWRCKTELVWKVAEEWYIGMDIKSVKGKGKDPRTLRERMISVAKQIRWIPTFGLGRELDWLDNMHDWLISKKRYWGLALPIWETEDGSEFEVIGSYEELKERAVEGWDLFEGKTPHRPAIDSIVIISKASGKRMRRVEDVGNVWLDAGIVPFSTISSDNSENPLYNTDRKAFDEWFPVDFITESFPGQFKNWFYSLIAMSTILEDVAPFKTVLGFGTMLDEKGHPFHKSAGNAIEFVEAADRFGADIIRWICASSNAANNVYFGEKGVFDVKRKLYLPFINIYTFFQEYSRIDHVDSPVSSLEITENTPVLDQWIISRLIQTIKGVDEQLSDYDSQTATRTIENFITDFSTWYIRRSRDRVWIHAKSKDDAQSFYQTTYTALVYTSIIMSPFLPFISEDIYTKLTGNDSVHLADWPHIENVSVDHELIEDMHTLRAIVEIAHRMRKEAKIKVRQPLASITVSMPGNFAFAHRANRDSYNDLLCQEVNVKAVHWQKGSVECIVAYDTLLTKELQDEGAVREIVRQIQAKRKEQKLRIDESCSITLPREYERYAGLLQQHLKTRDIVFHQGPDIVVEPC